MIMVELYLDKRETFWHVIVGKLQVELITLIMSALHFFIVCMLEFQRHLMEDRQC